jgi:hypothetical protein
MAPQFFDAIVQQDGIIILRNRNAVGQVVVLQPTLSGSSVTWRCIGGSARDVPARCK